MNYEPTNWKDGDLVTSAKLNKMEQGIANNSDSSGGNIEIVEAVSSNGDVVLQKTAGEIVEYVDSGKLVFLRVANAGLFNCGFMSMCYVSQGSYIFCFLLNQGPSAVSTAFFASDPSDYPTTNQTSGDNSGEQ